MSRLADGRLLVSYWLVPDSYASYGKPVGYSYSSDNGKTWRTTGKPKARFEVEEGVLLPNGDRLKSVELTPLQAKNYELPKSASDFVCSYGYPRSLYRADKLPRKLRGWRFSRLPAGGDKWLNEDATVNIPGELLHVTDETKRGAKPGIGNTAPVRDGLLTRPHLWGKIRVAADQSLWAVTYLWRLNDERPRYSALFLRSTDSGRTWKMVSEIRYHANTKVDSRAELRDGFTEPDYNFRPDGSIICLMRTMDGNGHGPLFLARSENLGKSWSNPTAFGRFGKVPQLLTLKSGVTLATYGASGGPGFFIIRATTDPSGLTWGSPLKVAISPVARGAWDTCGHTELVSLDDQTALMVYSDFNFPDSNNAPRKTILVRRIHVSKVDRRR